MKKRILGKICFRSCLKHILFKLTVHIYNYSTFRYGRTYILGKLYAHCNIHHFYLNNKYYLSEYKIYRCYLLLFNLKN